MEIGVDREYEAGAHPSSQRGGYALRKRSQCRLVAIVDGLSFTLVRGITWRVSGGVEVPGVTAPDVKVRARSW